MKSLSLHQKTKRLALCGLLSALGLLFLYLGTFLEVLDVSAAVLASFLAVIAVIEFGRPAGWLVYAVTAVLGLLLLQGNPFAALTYTCFAGYYPILKAVFKSRMRPFVCWTAKILLFNLSLGLLALLAQALFAQDIRPAWYLVAGVALLANLVFVVYDLALTRLITLYLFRLRKRFRIK
jgi:hypothetical protein